VVLEENEGVLMRSAHDLGVHRITLYRYIERYELWPVVNRLRRERIERRNQGKA
jgi:hypothetical protein